MQLLVSAMWGVTTAAVAALFSGGLLIAWSWAILFGDHTWPPWAMPVIGVASVLIGVLAGLLTGRGLWMHVQRLRGVSPGAARARLWALFLAGLGAMALVIAWIAHES